MFEPTTTEQFRNRSTTSLAFNGRVGRMREARAFWMEARTRSNNSIERYIGSYLESQNASRGTVQPIDCRLFMEVL